MTTPDDLEFFMHGEFVREKPQQGPWHVQRCGVVIDIEYSSGHCVATNICSEADARLIAAAPLMRDAIADLHEEIANRVIDAHICESDRWQALLDALNAAEGK